MTATRVDVAVIGTGPAGLAAAEAVRAAGRSPTLYDHKPSPGRKFLMAGRSGLNLTKAEPPDRFAAHLPAPLHPMLDRFGPAEAMAWAEALGEPLFTGSSGRVFPVAMKAAPLLRRWLARIGAPIRTRWRLMGLDDGGLRFQTPDGPRTVQPRATVLALGGASWPRLGSDGAWAGWLGPVAPFRPANMGFDVPWSPHMARHAGAPVKPAALVLGATRAEGEFVVTARGIEGSLVYALSAPQRDALEAGAADLRLDLFPGRSAQDLRRRLARPRGKASLATHLRKALGLTGVRAALARELGDPSDPGALKALPVPVAAPRPLAEAISSAGGLAWDALDGGLMLRDRPGVFAAGEMLDWEAPTGGYLITASMATGFHAGRAAAAWASRAP